MTSTRGLAAVDSRTAWHSAAVVAESSAFAFERRIRTIRATSPSKSSRTLDIGPGSYPDRPDRLRGHVDGLPPVAPGGGAATYGSDAIAGVMNVITRSHVDGFSFEGKHSVIDGSNGDSEMGS